MRPHSLTITAFGPFAGTETVDFAALSGAGLFLINGPTGAGKTSVLDAVCFALYGRVPSVRNDAKDLRSQHAPPDRAPEVVLDVTIRGRRFKITRSPRWERPKLRGSGTTEQKAKVLLQEWRGGAWETWSTRFDEAGQFVTDLLGMSADQFCQVVLLPQGDFAAFLRAGAEDRRAVLEKLFAAEVFAQVETWLSEHRRQAGREADELRLAAESVADRAAEAAGAVRPALSPVELSAWATELSGHVADLVSVTASSSAAAGAARDAARTLLEQARGLAERRERHADAVRRSAGLAARSAERAELTARLRMAERAARVLPLLRAAANRAAERGRAAAEVARRRAALRGRVPDDADADLMRKEERARRDELVELAQRREDETRLTALGAELRTTADETDELETREAELALFLTDSPAHREMLRASLGEARARATAFPAAEAAVASAASRLEAARTRDALAASLASAEAEHRTAVDEAQAARDVMQEIRQARLEGMAASLARELAEGEPCRVCGSASHPSPAHAEAEGPGEEAEASAAAAYDAALARREETGNAVTRLTASLEAAAERAGSSSEAQLSSELAAAEDELAGLAGAAADIERIEDELRRVEADLAEGQDRHVEIQTALAALQTHRTGLTAEAGRLRALIDAARGDDPTLEARVTRLDHEAGLLRDTAAEMERLRAAADEAETASAEAAAAASEEGFDSPASARAAVLDDPARDELLRQVRFFDDEEARVAALLDDPSLRAAAAEPPPALAALEAALSEAEARHRAAGSAHDRWTDRRTRLATLTRDLRARAAAWHPAADRHELAVRVAALASGDPGANRTRMRLSAYVLAARLEQVVAAANERLARMSSARYSLEHTVDRTAGSRGHGTGGLGLRVIDGWTGHHREPGTLSGGETFITSLSLALGLADVVTAEAGGTEIGTLFVDEGFGTLDEDTLDEVMEVLDGLRDGGRAVGIVSHVAELRTRIPAQLRVAKTRAGSPLTVTA